MVIPPVDMAMGSVLNLLHPPKEGGNVCFCLFICPSVRILGSYEVIAMKFYTTFLEHERRIEFVSEENLMIFSLSFPNYIDP